MQPSGAQCQPKVFVAFGVAKDMVKMVSEAFKATGPYVQVGALMCRQHAEPGILLSVQA